MSMLKGTKILVVEDEYLISSTIEELLISLGCGAVHTAARLREALEKSRTLPLDVALLDVNLAGELSYPAAEILKSRGIPFLFVTGYGTAGLPEDLRDILVLSKPFAETDLTEALQSLLMGRAARG
jgi:CheY-like chemotaxis protein